MKGVACVRNGRRSSGLAFGIFLAVFGGVAAGCAPRPVLPTKAVRSQAAPPPSRIVPRGNNLLKNSGFDDERSLPWTTSFSDPASGSAEVKAGALCATVNEKGKNPWDVQLRHRQMVVREGHSYFIQFRVFASAPTKARLKVGMAGPPYTEYWANTFEVGTVSHIETGRFKMSAKDDASAEFAFHIGGALARAGLPFDLCIDDVRLDDPGFAPPPEPKPVPVPKLAVNQLGYLPNAAKGATLESAAESPLEWQLLSAAGKSVAHGKTVVFGRDSASGNAVHELDFGAVRTPGRGYILEVGGERSFAFDLSTDLYRSLKYDALAYFFQNRSGMDIAMPYAGELAFARPLGHASDKAVGCLPGSGCNYTLDASHGWYDAGDHGKYVVNGGIALWTLQNQFERAKYLGSSAADFADGKLAIPEHDNGIPDLLDEARWELEFMLGMQVPTGAPRAGMVHHKLHDDRWTALATAPHEDTQARYLHPPSTAATLNLAATAAQGARIWKPFDAAFSAKCLSAAEFAWAAAQANPDVYAPNDDDQGGGSYADRNVADEFYWAAAELFVTTGKAEYQQFVDKSPLNAKVRNEASGGGTSLNWADTDTLGKISLAVVPSRLGAADVFRFRAQLRALADGYLKVERTQGYKSPLAPNAAGKYVWGSNSGVLNNLLVMALAFDFSKQRKYWDGVATGMDYLLGRNPLGQSYVSGYGDRPLKNPHHRFWAHEANLSYPRPPKGAVAGGPNSDLQDPYVRAAGLRGCAPQKCYVDDIEAYSVNEVAINWNAPLAWVAAFLDEKARAGTL